MSSPLTYRTFDELLSDVAIDLPTFHMEGMLDNAQLLKVALRVNYDLGLRIHQSKNQTIELNRGKAKLPDDFYSLDLAMITGKFRVEEPVLQGSHTEDVIISGPATAGDGTCLNKCGDLMYVKQTFKTEVRICDILAPLEMRASREISSGCPNLRHHGPHTGYIKNGYLYTNLQHGNIFITYLGNLVDDDGNLMVPNHPFLNEYYEYALKQRVLENMYMDGEDVVQKLQYIEPKLRAARNNALTVTNTPDFEELRQVHEMNRIAQRRRFYDIF